ncbi:MAG: energy transducer TonB [Nitrospirota bacterium]
MTRFMGLKKDITLPLTISFITHLTFIFLLAVFYLYSAVYKAEPFFVNMIDPDLLKGSDKTSDIITPKSLPNKGAIIKPHKESKGIPESDNTTQGKEDKGVNAAPPINSGNTQTKEGSAGAGQGEIPSLLREGLPFASKGDLEKYGRAEEYAAKKNSDPIKKNMEEFKYTAYFAKLKRRLEGVGGYPEIAKNQRLQGEVRINFTIQKNGKLGDLRLVSSSGYRILDEAALELLSDAAPYEAFPEEWNIEQLTIPLRVIYRINYMHVF